MDTNIEKDTPCSSIAVESIVRIGTAGALWGLCSGSYDANKLVGAAIAVGTRSKKEVAGMAALLSILGAAADYSRTL
uniref:Uncharacterized protein n=1 Tax=Chenopodium quinoa TaxID=63459 RepID=A0A803MPA2_CHEQI